MSISADPRHVTAAFAIAYIHWAGGHRLTVDQIRQWCHRDHIRKVGVDKRRNALYDLNDIIRHARKRGLLDTESQRCHS